MSDELLENLKLPQELSRDTTNLQRIASDIRRSINVDDPASIYYQRPDIAEAALTRLRALEIRAGATVAPKTPEALAREQHNAAWEVTENKAFNEMMLQRQAELDALGDKKLEEMAGALARELGPSYFTLLEQAKAGLGFAEVIPLATRADLGLLRCAAAAGQFAIAKQRNSKY